MLPPAALAPTMAIVVALAGVLRSAPAAAQPPREPSGDGTSEPNDGARSAPQDDDPADGRAPTDDDTEDGRAPADDDSGDRGAPADDDDPEPTLTSTMAPRAPTADDPEPFLRQDRAEPTSRLALVGATVGVEVPSADGDAAEYAAGPAWSAHARIEVAPWLGARAFFLEARHDVTIPESGLGLPGTRFGDSTLLDQRLGLSVEPTWVASPRVRAFAGLGIAWSRLSAGEVSLRPATGALGEPPGTHLDLRERRGVSLAYPLALGVIFDAITDWVALEASVEATLRSNQSGAPFDTARDVDADGRRTTVGALPSLGPSLGARVGVSVIP